jgi:predicted transcriptional regulator
MEEVAKDRLALEILLHLRAVKSDYVKSIVRNLKEPGDRVQEAVDGLFEMGLVEKVPSGMLKRKHVRLKRKLTTHQHHTYYTLSRKGDLFLRKEG